MNTDRKNSKKYNAFTLVEVMLLLVVVSLLFASSFSLITKKHRLKPRQSAHGEYACYRNNDGVLREIMYSGKSIVFDREANAATGCKFEAPKNVSYLSVHMVGAGGGGGFANFTPSVGHDDDYTSNYNDSDYEYGHARDIELNGNDANRFYVSLLGQYWNPHLYEQSYGDGEDPMNKLYYSLDGHMLTGVEPDYVHSKGKGNVQFSARAFWHILTDFYGTYIAFYDYTGSSGQGGEAKYKYFKEAKDSNNNPYETFSSGNNAWTEWSSYPPYSQLLRGVGSNLSNDYFASTTGSLYYRQIVNPESDIAKKCQARYPLWRNCPLLRLERENGTGSTITEQCDGGGGALGGRMGTAFKPFALQTGYQLGLRAKPDGSGHQIDFTGPAQVSGGSTTPSTLVAGGKGSTCEATPVRTPIFHDGTLLTVADACRDPETVTGCFDADGQEIKEPLNIDGYIASMWDKRYYRDDSRTKNTYAENTTYDDDGVAHTSMQVSGEVAVTSNFDFYPVFDGNSDKNKKTYSTTFYKYKKTYNTATSATLDSSDMFNKVNIWGYLFNDAGVAGITSQAQLKSPPIYAFYFKEYPYITYEVANSFQKCLGRNSTNPDGSATAGWEGTSQGRQGSYPFYDTAFKWSEWEDKFGSYSDITGKMGLLTRYNGEFVVDGTFGKLVNDEYGTISQDYTNGVFDVSKPATKDLLNGWCSIVGANTLSTRGSGAMWDSSQNKAIYSDVISSNFDNVSSSETFGYPKSSLNFSHFCKKVDGQDGCNSGSLNSNKSIPIERYVADHGVICMFNACFAIKKSWTYTNNSGEDVTVNGVTITPGSSHTFSPVEGFNYWYMPFRHNHYQNSRYGSNGNSNNNYTYYAQYDSNFAQETYRRGHPALGFPAYPTPEERDLSLLVYSRFMKGTLSHGERGQKGEYSTMIARSFGNTRLTMEPGNKGVRADYPVHGDGTDGKHDGTIAERQNSGTNGEDTRFLIGCDDDGNNCTETYIVSGGKGGKSFVQDRGTYNGSSTLWQSVNYSNEDIFKYLKGTKFVQPVESSTRSDGTWQGENSEFQKISFLTDLANMNEGNGQDLLNVGRGGNGGYVKHNCWLLPSYFMYPYQLWDHNSSEIFNAYNRMSTDRNAYNYTFAIPIDNYDANSDGTGAAAPKDLSEYEGYTNFNEAKIAGVTMQGGGTCGEDYREQYEETAGTDGYGGAIVIMW